MRQLLLLTLFWTTAFSSEELKLNVQKHTLPNGLKVLLYPNKQAPQIACRLFYTTGSVHERAGNSGIAHMLEHMLFKGTKKTGVTDTILDAKYLKAIDETIAKAYSAKRSGDSTTYKTHWAKYDSL